MKIKIAQSTKATIYVENTYEGMMTDDVRQTVESIPWTNWMQIWLDNLRLTDKIADDCELSLRLASDRQIQTFNHQYRAIDRPTDVLAFAATEADLNFPSDLAEPIYLGDIVISLDTAVKQATESDRTLRLELAWLASHGLLHLLGWDHPDNDSLQQMLDKQSALIKLLDA